MRARLRHKGLTLLETVIAIVIGLVILAGVGMLVYRATRTNKVGEAFTEVAAIVKNIQNLYAGTTPNGNIDTNMQTYIDAGAIPENMISGSRAVTPWGGGVTFNPAVPSWTPTTTEVSLQITGTTMEDCNALGAKLNTLTSGGRTYMDINSHGWRQNTSIANIAAYCNRSTGNVIIFAFPAR